MGKNSAKGRGENKAREMAVGVTSWSGDTSITQGVERRRHQTKKVVNLSVLYPMIFPEHCYPLQPVVVAFLLAFGQL
jgi:hypothetical protein